MSRRCCIAVCPNAKAGVGNSVSYFPFPADAQQRTKWIEFFGTDPSRFQWRSKYICSAHFSPSTLLEVKGKPNLSEGAIPEIFIAEDAKDDESDIVEDDAEMETENLSDSEIGIDTDEIKTEEIDLRALFCRICLKKSQNLIPLDSQLHDTPLVDVIHIVSRLEIVEDEQLPTTICGPCVEKIDVAYSVYLEINNHCQALTKLIENKQLESYYKFYDEQKDHGDGSDDYLNTLIQNFKQEQEYLITTLEPNPNMTAQESDAVASDTVGDDEYEICYEEYLEEADNETIEIVTQPEVKREQSPTIIPEKTRKRTRKEKVAPPPTTMTRQIRKMKKAGTIPRMINEYRPPPKLIPNTCYICNTSHETAEALEDHMAVHVNVLPFKCADCHCDEFPAVFKTLVLLNRHLLSHLYPYKCDYCWNKSPSRYGYKAHMRNMHDSLAGDGYTCDTCGKFFTSNGAFRRHVQKHRALEEERHKCKHCGRLFTLPQLLQRHERIHTGEKPFECKTCGKCFNHEHNFRLHTRRHIRENPYSCDVCGKTFTYSGGLRLHMARHFPDDPKYREKKLYVTDKTNYVTAKPVAAEDEEYRCDVEGCNFVCYRSKSREIYNHRNRHTRPYACTICQKTYITNQSLKIHFASAHDDKPPEKIFQCTYCPKWFRDNNKLRQHVNIHEDIRNFKCRFCEKAFVQKINCTAHERIHTGEQPHACRYCTAKFSSPSQRNKHEAKCHPEMLEQATQQQ